MAEKDRPSRNLMDKLLEQRIILLSEPVMPKSSQRIVAQLLYLDNKDSAAPIQFYINTPGGSVSDGFAIFDTARLIRAPVKTVCTGMSASMGTILMLCPREKKDRVCLPNTRIMIHQPSGGYQGSASDIEIGAREILKLRDRLIDVYVTECGIDADQVRKDMGRDHWLTAQEAVDYGLLDRVVERLEISVDRLVVIGAFLTALVLYAAVHVWLSLRQERHVLTHRAAVPAAFRDEIPLYAHQKAADYTVTRTRFGRVALAWRFVVLLGFTLGGGLDLLAGAVASPTLFVVAAFLLADAARLPLGIYSTFVIEERFGFNRTTPRLFVVDLVRGTLLALAIGAPAAYGALWLMGHGGALWWVWLWGSWLGFSLFFAWAYPVLIAPLFHKFTPLEAGGLNDRIAALLERTGFASRGVFVMDGSRRSARASAYFTGFGKQKRIVIFDTLQSMLAADEIEAVLAHELGHFKLRHLWQRLAGSAALGLAGLAAFALIADRAWFQTGLGVSDPTPQAALVLFAWVGPLFTFLASPLLSAWSRRHEYEADAFAADHADGGALVRALVRLYEHNAATLTPDPLHSAFHDSHPPAPLRIARLVSS